VCTHPLARARSEEIAQSEREASILQVQGHFSVKRSFLSLVALCSIISLIVHGQNQPTNAGEWSGIVVSSACDADEAFNGSPECNEDVPGAKLALYDDTNRVMYSLEPQSQVTAHLGDVVRVRGTLDGETIRIAALEPMAIGLAVGQKAPVFSLRDQFGHVQTLDSLKGANGTLLLFFRSADW
jgi:hypothetical protein